MSVSYNTIPLTNLSIVTNSLSSAIFLNTSNNFSSNITVINNILQNRCNCSGCITQGSNCNMPFGFYTGIPGILNINLINATYAYGIDNCSNSFGIPNNATTLIETFKDSNNNLLNVNFSQLISSSLLNISFTLNKNNVNTSNICIYPNWFSNYVDIQTQYQYGTINLNYYYQNYLLNNLTSYINFTIDTNGNTPITATVYDNFNTPIEGAYIIPQRYDWATNTYIPVGTYKTDFEGKTIMYLTLNTVYYKFLIYYPLATLNKITSSNYLYATTINFQIDTTPEVLEQYFISEGIYFNLSFNEVTDNFKFEYADSTNLVSQGCLKVWQQSLNGNTLINTSCVIASSGTIYINVINTSGATYIGKSFVYINGNEIPKSVYSFTFPPNNVFGNMGLVIWLLLTIVFAFTIFFSIPLGVMMIPLPTIFLSAIHLISFDVNIALSLEIAAMVIAVFINSRG